MVILRALFGPVEGCVGDLPARCGQVESIHTLFGQKPWNKDRLCGKIMVNSGYKMMNDGE